MLCNTISNATATSRKFDVDSITDTMHLNTPISVKWPLLKPDFKRLHYVPWFQILFQPLWHCSTTPRIEITFKNSYSRDVWHGFSMFAWMMKIEEVTLTQQQLPCQTNPSCFKLRSTLLELYNGRHLKPYKMVKVILCWKDGPFNPWGDLSKVVDRSFSRH